MNATTSTELRAAYRWHRQNVAPLANFPARSAAVCLGRARADVAAGKKRYPAPVKPYAAVHWQESGRGEKLGHPYNPAAAGLRFVGRVAPESYGGRDKWDSSCKTGWFTDPYGEGWNLCFGVVYQLPARNGKAQFVAGYDFDEDEGGLVLDFGRIFESDTDSDYYPSNRNNGDGAKEAAYAADEMARRVAESEKEYQTAWEAGSLYADTKDELANDRATARRLLAERRAAKAAGAAYPTICATIERAIRNALADIKAGRETLEQLASGGYSRGDYHLGFYPSDEMKAAFNDGAGTVVLP